MRVELGADVNNLTDVRRYAHHWVDIRPTLNHTRETLLEVVFLEAAELEEAINEKGQKNIGEETRDVIFSLMTLDERREEPPNLNKSKSADPKHIIEIINSIKRKEIDISSNEGCLATDVIYSIAENYFQKRNSSLLKEMENNILKNKINYLFLFFNEMSPFTDANDAKICLRIFRENMSLQEIDNIWLKVWRTQAEMPFFDDYHARGQFRQTIQEQLKKILISNKTDKSLRRKIKELLGAGNWSMAPNDIPNTRVKWKTMRGLVYSS